MEQNLAVYVVRFYGHFMSEHEHLALRHLTASGKATHGRTDKSAQQEAGRHKAFSKLLSRDPMVLELTSDGIEAFTERTASRILAEHGEQIILNNCPRCGALAATPKARQCRVCLHDWHEVSLST